MTTQIPAFDFGREVYAGETESVEADGFTFTATIHADDDCDAPWEREDGHGPVSEWRRAGYSGHVPKSPGERPLCTVRGSARFYDFAEACKIAMRDGWGASPYRLDTEHGANGLVRVTGQWFAGRELQTFRSDWSDDVNAAIREVYAAHRATMTPRQYAALAAESDFERLRRWCADQWSYVGVSVTVEFKGVELVGEYEHALWGIESDSGEYIAEVAAELAAEALESARAKLAELAA